MDDVRLGQFLRAARIRRGWRQEDLASRAGVGRTVISNLERGDIASTSVAVLRRVASVLEVRVEIQARWRGGDGERLVSARHSSLMESVTRWLMGRGWDVRPEVSFSIYGERGVIDLVAWHASRRALLVVEIKTEIVDVGELIGTFDRKRRLSRRVASELGWTPETVSAWLVVAESRTNRRRVAEHLAALRSTLPSDGRRLRGWVRNPIGSTSGLTFMPYSVSSGTRTTLGGPKRVRRRESVPSRPGASVRGVPRAVASAENRA